MDEVVLAKGITDEVVTAPSQLLLLDRKATTLLSKLLVNPNGDPDCISATELANRVLGMVARLNSREALVACVVCALVASDDCTLQRGIEIERSICDLMDIVARVKREPRPKYPAWLKIAQQLLEEEKKAADDAVNQTLSDKVKV